MKTTITIAVAAATFALGATAGGVAVATSKPATSVKACTTTHGVLTLASHNGHCAKGSRKVTIAKTGPQGKTGARGPGAMSSVVSNNTSSTTAVSGATHTVPGTTLALHTVCTAGSIAELQIVGKGSYTIDGSYQFSAFNASGAGIVYHAPANSTTTGGFPGPSGVLDYSIPTPNDVTTTELRVAPGEANSIGSLSLHMLVTDGAVTFTAEVFLFDDPQTCTATAQITPVSR